MMKRLCSHKKPEGCFGVNFFKSIHILSVCFESVFFTPAKWLEHMSDA